MIFVLYSVLLSFIIPFLFFILPILGKSIDYSYDIPIQVIINIIITLVICGLIFIFHINNTSNSCNKINILGAFLNSFKAFIILIFWVFLLDYYPSIIEPFYNVFKINGRIATIIYKSIMIYGVVFLILTYTNFNSIKDTCKASLQQIKEAYTILQKELNTK
jgi:hypothetical protein